MRIDILNHAALLLTSEQTSLLTDPWLEGTAFSGGWGLRHQNPAAFDVARHATHLWVSHWHSDHMHIPTLRKLATAAPTMKVWANESANFSMKGAFENVGFRHIDRFLERVTVSLAPRIDICRYPATTIDNMLLFRAEGRSVLNYNDCNLPLASLRRLRAHFGPIDVLLTNYNHATKLLGSESDEAIKDARWTALRRVVDTLEPRFVVPFASSHFYRSTHSTNQNASMIGYDEVVERAAGDPRILVVRPGEAVEWAANDLAPKIVTTSANIIPTPLDVLDYGKSQTWETVLQTVEAYRARLRRGYLGLMRLLKPVRIRIWDHERTIELDLHRGVRILEGTEADAAHVVLHSVALVNWMGRDFGDDTFFAGAHFAVGTLDPKVVRPLALFSALASNHMTLRNLQEMFGSRRGREFFFNRREEIVGTILGAKFNLDLRQ